MDLAQFWFQAAGGPAPAVIGNSLRFRGGQDLSKTFSGTFGAQVTASMWVKLALVDSRNLFFCTTSSGTGNYMYVAWNETAYTSGVNRFTQVSRETTNDTRFSDGLQRDPAAWYHIFITADGKFYINGVPQSAGSYWKWWTTANQCRIGSFFGSSHFNGYMSEVHVVDGQNLAPTDFGEFNADGVWVPKAVDLAIAAYGTPGTDWAGAWSPGANNPGNAFDGDITTSTSANGSVTWTAPAPITGTTFRIYCAAGASRAQIGGHRGWYAINGTDISQKIMDANFLGAELEHGWLDISAEAAGNLTTITMVAQKGVTNPGLYLLEVDGAYVGVGASGYGTNGFYLDFSDAADIGADRSGNGNNFTATGFELTDTTSTSYDWMADSPTDNYGTFNPLHPRGAGTSDADANLLTSALHSGNPNRGTPFTTIKLPESGKFYAEITPLTVGEMGIGLFAGLGATVGDTVIQYYRAGGIYVNGSGQVGTGAGYGVGDVIGVAVDAAAQTVQFYKNGVAQHVATSYATAPSADNCYLSFVQGSSSGSCRAYLNYGNRPFAHTPPAGFKPLSTAELPAVAVTNPSDHFQTILGSGGSSVATIQYGGDHPTSTRAQHDGRVAVEDAWTGPIFDWAATIRASGLNGYNDWYVPSIQESYLLYTVFKPHTGATAYSRTSSYTVPPINTSGTTQTIFPEFKDTGAEMIPWWGYHWTMTPSGAGAGIKFYFNDANIDSVAPGSQAQMGRLVRREAFTGSEPAVGSAYAGGYLAGFMSDTSGGPANWALIVSPADGGQYGFSPPILDKAQATFPNGLWWIKDRANSNQHQLVDSVRGGNLALQCPAHSADTAYVAPAGNSVAWCWNAPDAFTSSTGDLAVTGSRNQGAGFSICTYSGNGAATASLEHGLAQEPEFVIVKARTDANKFFTVYHKSISAGTKNCLELHSTANLSQVVGDFFGATQDFNSTTFTVGNTDPSASNSTNLSGTDYAAYCWAEVEGYSKFGIIEGNYKADGPFVYLGFTPAFIMLKNAERAGTNWLIIDTARDPYNYAGKALRPSQTNGEDAYAERLDVLSNGFKLRTTDLNYNGPDSTPGIIYAAFAEHPMGGSNVSPAPAR